MPCNYLVKFESEEKYSHVIIEGCNSSSSEQVAVSQFYKRNKINPKNFNAQTYKGDLKIWVISVVGCAIFEELFEISLGQVRLLIDPSKPMSMENSMPGTGFVAKKIDNKLPKLLPGLEGYI